MAADFSWSRPTGVTILGAGGLRHTNCTAHSARDLKHCDRVRRSVVMSEERILTLAKTRPG